METEKQTCKVCGHLKSEHSVHVAPDHTGQKIKHVGCRVRVKTDYINDFLGQGNTMSIGHTCSCHGVKPNTSLKNAIKKYQKYLKTLDPNLVCNMYRRKEIKEVIKRFKKDVEDNPENKLWWQKQEIVA